MVKQTLPALEEFAKSFDFQSAILLPYQKAIYDAVKKGTGAVMLTRRGVVHIPYDELREPITPAVLPTSDQSS